MPVYPWQYRNTLRRSSRQLAIGCVVHLGLISMMPSPSTSRLQQLANSDVTREVSQLQDSMVALRKVIVTTDEGTFPKVGHEREANECYEQYQREWQAAMARVGKSLARSVDAIAPTAKVNQLNVAALLRFFTTTHDDIPSSYAIPIPNGPLKLKPFLAFDGGWALPSLSLLLPVTSRLSSARQTPLSMHPRQIRRHGTFTKRIGLRCWKPAPLTPSRAY